MKSIISYNVNGIRAALKKGLDVFLETEQPDIFCIQELKASSDQFDENVFINMGYNCFWHSAQKKGYSGVAILSKEQPKEVVVGMDMEKYDQEGRVLIAHYEKFSLISVYIPSGTTGGIRQDFKMDFLSDFQNFVIQLLKKQPNLIITGDLNICHKAIDINHPERHKKSSGFLPEERSWFDDFLNVGFTDAFRKTNQEPNNYSWWSYRANSREKNLGWRIDYHLVSNTIQEKINNYTILNQEKHSDHCPIKLEIEI
ncbi:MAG: exodeoxyribonuclease III [Bacteroidales bacterium]|nr:exodeoxyribonuclease III [Bacteroidales bacterium]